MHMASLIISLYLILISVSIFCLLIIISLLGIIKKKAYHRKTTNFPLPPGPKPWPIFGCIFEMIRNKPTYKWIHKIMYEMNTEIAYIPLCRVQLIIVTSSELAGEILKTQDSIFSSRPLSTTAEISSNGYLSVVFSPSNNQWKKMKRILVSSLISSNRHAWITSKIAEEADYMVRNIFNQCKNSTTTSIVNIRTTTRQYCANLIKSVIFGKRFFEDVEEEEEHGTAFFTILAHIHTLSISDFLPWIKVFDLDGHRKEVTQALTIVRKYHDPQIKDRIHMWENGLKTEQVDFLDVLLMLKDEKNGKPMLTIAEIQVLIIDLMIATVDNPSNAVEWALAEMINKPEMLVRAREELDIIVGKERLVKPERHLKKSASFEVVLNDPELNLFSFGTGRQGCPGVAMGSTMTILMMARLPQGFTWTLPPNISKIELIESKNDLFLAKPLLACAKPRLPNNVYPKC